MIKITLEIFLCLGIAIIYALALIAATMILAKVLGIENADDFDYVRIANIIQFFVIQFFVMFMVITGKIAQWMV